MFLWNWRSWIIIVLAFFAFLSLPPVPFWQPSPKLLSTSTRNYSIWSGNEVFSLGNSVKYSALDGAAWYHSQNSFTLLMENFKVYFDKLSLDVIIVTLKDWWDENVYEVHDCLTWWQYQILWETCPQSHQLPWTLDRINGGECCNFSSRLCTLEIFVCIFDEFVSMYYFLVNNQMERYRDVRNRNSIIENSFTQVCPTMRNNGDMIDNGSDVCNCSRWYDGWFDLLQSTWNWFYRIKLAWDHLH